MKPVDYLKLSVLERIKLLAVLPVEGSFLTLKIVRRLRDALSFSEAEHKDFGLRESGGMFLWGRSENRMFRFGPKALEVIKTTIVALDSAGKLPAELVDVAARFLPPVEDEEESTESEVEDAVAAGF